MKVTRDSLVKIADDPIELFYQGIKSSASRISYTRKLRQVLCDYLEDVLEGSLEKRAAQLVYKAKAHAKVKEIPSDGQLARFCVMLPYQVQVVFLILHDSGLRLGEVLALRIRDIDYESCMVNASESHSGDTKLSWVSFVTKNTLEFLNDYIVSNEFTLVNGDEDNSKLFTISARYVQQAFKDASDKAGVHINPHLLRTVFTEKCTMAGIKDKYINAFCGRIPRSVLAKNYTDYSPNSLRRHYDAVEPLLTLNLH
jgi:integrase